MLNRDTELYKDDKRGENPSISVIILNYNGWRDTIECLDSLLEVSYQDLNIIIVDNNSTNNSKDKILDWINKKSFEITSGLNIEIDGYACNTYIKSTNNKEKWNIIFIESFINLGFSGGNNLAIRYALNIKSDYIMLLNNDCIVEKDFLQPLVETLLNNNKIGMVSGKICDYFNPQNYIAGGYISYLKGSGYHFYNDNRKELRVVDFLSGCLWLIKREVFEKVGLLDEKFFLYVEDVEFCNRVKKNGFDLVYIPKSIIYHKESQSTGKDSPSIVYYNTRNRLYFVRKTYDNIFMKILFYIFFSTSRSIKILQNKENLIPIKDGIRDFLLDKYGEYSTTNNND